LKAGGRDRKKTTHPAPRLLTVLVVMALVIPAPGWSGGVQDSLERPAAVCRNAERSVLLDVARAGNRLVAVGERGIIIWPDDTGKSWHQAEVPASESLTAVDFPMVRKIRAWADRQYLPWGSVDEWNDSAVRNHGMTFEDLNRKKYISFPKK
jgi:hypothetical protein